MVILDTNIIIDHLRQNKKGTAFDKIAQSFSKKSLAISIISAQELYEGESTKDEEKEKVLISVINSIRILPYTYEVATLAGRIARDLKRSIGFADAAIAASAIINGYQLYTLNKKHFQGIKELELA
ncbi:MAG: PIN domain-containing protein [Patescibacteria group bacterium]